MRINRSATGKRRSHHGLKKPRLSTCDNCGEKHIRHKICENCGFYKGKQYIDVEAQIAKKMERRKRKLKEQGKDPTEATPEEN